MFTFAWCEEEDAFDPMTHGVEDELIFSFEEIEEENNWCILEVEMLNDFTGGFLTPGKQWIWFAEDGVPRFKGRILGVPQEISERVISISFYGRASDHEVRKNAKAQTLKVFPYVDMAFLAPERRNDPDAVLDARPDYWHIHKITHDVDIVSMITPDTIYDLTSEAFEVKFSHSGEPPANTFRMTAYAQWDQIAIGVINIADAIGSHTSGLDTPGYEYDNVVFTYTGLGLLEDWPPEGTTVGSDYTIGESIVYSVGGRSSPSVVEDTQYVAGRFLGNLPIWQIYIEKIDVNYDVVRRRTEKMEFTLRAQTQRLFADPGSDTYIDEQLSSVSLNELLDDSGSKSPLRDPRQATYFNSVRGIESVKYLIQYAATMLLIRAGAGELEVEISFDRGKTLTLFNGFKVDDSRLPNGTCTAKITRISSYGSGEGEFGCVVSGRVMCGTGAANPVGSLGAPVWVNHGWVESGWQAEIGGVEIIGAGYVGFSSISDIVSNDDGIDFFNPKISDFVDHVVVHGTVAENKDKLTYDYRDDDYYVVFDSPSGLIGAIEETKICVHFNIIDKGPFETFYPVTVTDLAIPKMVDL